jgi:hypothetical protein
MRTEFFWVITQRIVVIIIIIIIIVVVVVVVVVISFMQGIYTYIPEKNQVPRKYFVAAVLLLLFMVPISLVPAWLYCTFTLALSEVCVQCPIWLFSLVP